MGLYLHNLYGFIIYHLDDVALGKIVPGLRNWHASNPLFHNGLRSEQGVYVLSSWIVNQMCSIIYPTLFLTESETPSWQACSAMSLLNRRGTAVHSSRVHDKDLGPKLLRRSYICLWLTLQLQACHSSQERLLEKLCCTEAGEDFGL